MRNDNFIDFAKEMAETLQGSREAHGYLDARDSAALVILDLIDMLNESNMRLAEMEKKLNEQ